MMFRITATLALLLPAHSAAAAELPRGGVFEAELTAANDHAHPLADVTPRVRFTAPDGRSWTVDAFWDGGRTWRVRFSPDAAGRWDWRSVCDRPHDAGLHDQSGEFTVADRAGPILPNGPLRLSKDRTHFVRADGEPFFWLADTAWNGALRSDADGWARYLKARSDQRFTTIQFVSTQWRGGRKVLDRPVYVGENPVGVDPEVFRRLDERVRAINEAGLVASPVVLWALQPDDPGEVLPVEDAIRLARYIVARWGAYDVVWMLGGDGRYRDAERWQRIGRDVFGGRDPESPMFRPVTLHPSGQSWIHDRFGREEWIDFIGYQSGHGDGKDSLKWHVSGPPAEGWREEPTRPVINMEPNYEAHPAYQSKKLHPPFHVRRAAYWSMLISPPAGVTYGHNAIWPWNEEAGSVEGHGSVGRVEPWHSALDAPGARQMTVLRAFFESGPWTELRPAREIVKSQAAADNPERFVAAARTADGGWVVAYLPAGGKVSLDLSGAKRPAVATWIDPRTGERRRIGDVSDDLSEFRTPDGEDWVLEIRSK